jgi:hypothetical protein
MTVTLMVMVAIAANVAARVASMPIRNLQATKKPRRSAVGNGVA